MTSLDERIGEYINLFAKSLENGDDIKKLIKKLKKMFIEIRKDVQEIEELYIGAKTNAENVLLHRV